MLMANLVNSLNVAEDILRPGIVVQKIDRQLHIEDRSQWKRRLSVDKLVKLAINADYLQTDR